MSITTFKSAVRSRDSKVIRQAVEAMKASGLTEREVYRIAKAGDPDLTQDEWSDILAAS